MLDVGEAEIVCRTLITFGIEVEHAGREGSPGRSGNLDVQKLGRFLLGTFTKGDRGSSNTPHHAWR